LLTGLKRVIRQVKPDLIHAGPIQTSALLAALSGFRPLVSMSWGYDLLVDANRNQFWRWATRYALQHSDVMVGDCRTIRQQAISFGMPDERIITFPWGIDLSHFNVSTFKRSNVQTFFLLSTRGWEPIYGVDVIAQAFVKAAKEVQARRAHGEDLPELRLIMLGNGSQASLIRQIFAEGGVLDQIGFPGHAGYLDLPGYYHSADLYVSASHSDGSSISLLEAMACGRPVLVSDIPGNREWVRHGEEGWWFPDGDAGALARAILRAVEDRHRLPDMGQKARCVAEQRADWNKNFPKLIMAYDMALSNL
jgi:glycosyltransferase involved in cell wall biosynthesis